MEKAEKSRHPAIDIFFDEDTLCSPETGECDLQLPFIYKSLVYKGAATVPSDFKASYDQYYDVIFDISLRDFPSIINHTTLDLQINVTGSTDIIELLTMKTSLCSSNEINITLTPNKNLYPIQFHNEVTYATAYLLNGPNTIFSNPLTLSTQNFNFEINPSKKLNQFYKNHRQHKNDYLITHFINITPKSVQAFTADKVTSELGEIVAFLTFIKGGQVGFGHLVGITNDKKVGFLGLGFSSTDQFHHNTSWNGKGTVSHLSEIFNHYQDACVDTERGKIINRTFGFYRAAIVARSFSTETAIITSFASLETIVPYILTNYGGWSGALISERIPFHDKLRAVAKLIKLTSKPLNKETLVANRQADFNKADDFELLSIFRNRIVHQNKPFKYSGQEIHEIWTLSQWLVEMCVFYLIDYKGPIYDSRQQTGVHGPEINVPIE